MIKLKDLTVTSDGIPIIKNINIDVQPGEIHAVVGPKYCGKSAIAHAITGHPTFEIESGGIFLGRKKLNKLSTEDRVNNKIFISFQSPPDFEDFTAWSLYQTFFNLRSSEIEFLRLKYIAGCELFNLNELHLEKNLHPTEMTLSQFKRNELLHMLLSDPKFVIIDEIDDGLSDDEAAFAGIILREFLAENNRSCLITSRNKKFLDVVKPTHTHLMINGEIRLSGGSDLYKRIIDDEHSEFS